MNDVEKNVAKLTSSWQAEVSQPVENKVLAKPVRNPAGEGFRGMTQKEVDEQRTNYSEAIKTWEPTKK